MLLRPALMHQAQHAARNLQGGQSLHGAHVDGKGLEEPSHPDAVEPPVIVAGQLVSGSQLARQSGFGGGIHRVLIHSEALHYSLMQGFRSSYPPGVVCGVRRCLRRRGGPGRGGGPRRAGGRAMIVDAHLDIGWNAIGGGRGFLGLPAPRYLISRSSLTSAGVGLVFATLYTAPARARRAMRTRFVYEDAHEAYIMAVAEVNYYRSCGLHLIRDSGELDAYVRNWKRGQIAAVLLMEGADPIETPSQLGAWTDMGLRIIGPAWSRTRYSGGTGAPGGLTELGVQLLKAMRRKRVILDLSHMADQAVADAFDLWRGPIIASHSNARELVPGDRQITEATAAEIARRGGILGISFFQRHLRATGRATLHDVVRHFLHLARAAGGPERVGLGTDLDGGFGAKYAPFRDLSEIRGLPSMLRRHFSARQVDGIMGSNWLEFLSRSLP